MYRVTHQAFRAALLSRGKNDRRPYLNAFHFDSEGFIISTDGHRLFCGKADTESSESITIDVLGKEPSKFDYAEISTSIANFYSDESGLLCSLPVKFIDEPYPNWRRVTQFNEGKLSAVGFTGIYLSDVAKAAKIYGLKVVKMEFQDNTNASRIALSDTDYMMLMPARIK